MDIQDIQGNILAGFNKDFQNFLFLKIIQPQQTKKWLKELLPEISSLEEVLRFNNLFKSMRERLGGRDPQGLTSTWINVAFTYVGLEKLVPDESVHFTSEAFKDGMPRRSLGDRLNPEQWEYGGWNNYPDFVLIVASDNENFLQERVNTIKKMISENVGLRLIQEEVGRVLPDKPGHEHFGFKDGISQPGVRGRISDGDHDYLTPRLIDPDEKRSLSFSKPGELLIWPGEFVFGYPAQGARPHPDDDIQPLLKGPDMYINVPKWARNGSYLVFRRLRQDVKAFQDSLKQIKVQTGLSEDLIGAKLMGRWPSGAPIIRSPEHDQENIGKDAYESNHFSYNEVEPPIKMSKEVGGRVISGATNDRLGGICPFSAHIRKVNPRDMGTDLGSAEQTLLRRIIRRGIPFGRSFNEVPEEERGLLFISYQTSIERQFEFLQKTWANNKKNPPGSEGEDPIIGQNTSTDRSRTFVLEHKTLNLQEFVTMTGGGYFFQPSISAINEIITKHV
ncbi:Dyp-type peroxidase [Paenibacillus sp. BGI2013]|uniref:Dyp-type peroxidase n=1 Tax=Paenibacillus sp. BGI2013 TaxID=2058902 RepID=UPI0015D5F80A|nr:Dyp-type peroxidase [Paenibacillus sp. BGI2013]